MPHSCHIRAKPGRTHGHLRAAGTVDDLQTRESRQEVKCPPKLWVNRRGGLALALPEAARGDKKLACRALPVLWPHARPPTREVHPPASPGAPVMPTWWSAQCAAIWFRTASHSARTAAIMAPLFLRPMGSCGGFRRSPRRGDHPGDVHGCSRFHWSHGFKQMAPGITSTGSSIAAMTAISSRCTTMRPPDPLCVRATK
jgi:hypothetical protein